MSSVYLPCIRHHIWLTFLVMMQSYWFILSFSITSNWNSQSFRCHGAGCSKYTSLLSVSFTVKPPLSLSSVCLTVVFICVKLTEHVTAEITQTAHKWILILDLLLCVHDYNPRALRSARGKGVPAVFEHH